MVTRVGLVGLGRIGRNIFRILYKREDIRVAAISEILGALAAWCWTPPDALRVVPTDSSFAAASGPANAGSRQR